MCQDLVTVNVWAGTLSSLTEGAGVETKPLMLQVTSVHLAEMSQKISTEKAVVNKRSFCAREKSNLTFLKDGFPNSLQARVFLFLSLLRWNASTVNALMPNATSQKSERQIQRFRVLIVVQWKYPMQILSFLHSFFIVWPLRLRIWEFLFYDYDYNYDYLIFLWNHISVKLTKHF